MKPVVLLLIAGKSKRFWPLKEKSLWRIAGKTVLEYQVERIKTAGCKDILLVGGAHNKKDAKKLFPSFPFIEQKSYEHGMQDAMLAALPKCKGRPIIVIGGNDVVDVNAYKKLLAIASKKNIDGAILAKEVHEYFPGGYIKMKGSRIGAIVEKPGKGKEPSNFINIVAHYHRNPEALLATLKKTTSKSDDGYERALTSLFTTHTYVPVRYDGVWYPIKFPWHLLALLEGLLKNISKPTIPRTVQVHPSAVIMGNVILGEGTRVLPHATIVGPCVIGPQCIIGNNALVRESSIGARTVVGYSTEIVRSVIGNDVWTHSCYIGDSIIADNVAFGGGSFTANLRLDEGPISSVLHDHAIDTGLVKLGVMIGEGSRLGVRVTTAPGVKIGAGSFIASTAYLTTDVPDASFIKVTPQGLDIRHNTRPAPKAADRLKFKKKSRW